MATFQYYNVSSCRGIIGILSGLGVVLPTQPVPQAGGTSPFSYSIGSNTYQFYSGPNGGPHPGWVSGLGVEGDYQAWNGLRCAVAFSPQVWTSFAVDPTYDVDSPFTYGTSSTKAYGHALHDRSSVDGASYVYKIVLVVAHYTPALGSWNYFVTSGGGDLAGGVAVAGMSLSASSIQDLAEAIAGMIQIINNVSVGDDLLPALSSIQTSCELLATALGADGFQGSFDAAMNLLIDKFGATGPFATLAADLQSIRDNLGSSGPAGEVVTSIAQLVAALGAGGILGALSSGGTIPAALSNLSPILSAIQSVGQVANAIAQFQQSAAMSDIAEKIGNVSTGVTALKVEHASSMDLLRGRITADGAGDLGYVLTNNLPAIASSSSTMAMRLAEMVSKMTANIGGVEYDLVEAIHAFAGGGSGGGSCDMTALVAKLEEIRAILASGGTGGGGVDLDRLKEILDPYFLITRDGETWSAADLLFSLINTGWIIYK